MKCLDLTSSTWINRTYEIQYLGGIFLGLKIRLQNIQLDFRAKRGDETRRIFTLPVLQDLVLESGLKHNYRILPGSALICLSLRIKHFFNIFLAVFLLESIDFLFAEKVVLASGLLT